MAIGFMRPSWVWRFSSSSGGAAGVCGVPCSPLRYRRWARWLSYLSLAALVVFPVAFHFRLWAELVFFIWLFYWHGHWAELILLLVLVQVLVLVPASVLVLRPFCRYLCAMVPLFRLFSLYPLVGRRADSACCLGLRKLHVPGGWDPRTAVPRPETLRQLGLTFAAPEGDKNPARSSE